APVETLRRAYDQMGRSFSAEHAERIEHYLREKPKGKFGMHKYTAEEWGFDADDLRQRLAPYIDHFGVSLER
ncbi:MAG: sulfotransferase, partial [Deltaproteobacteria bacterium]|nr:sulfotransferase [Deltaproteobacteria bacterium]